MTASTATANAINILTSPREAFRSLQDRPTVMVPLLLLMAAAGLRTFFYMNGVDVEWFFETMILQSGDATPEQAEQFAGMIAGVPQLGLALILSLAGVIAVPIVLLLQALYFKIVTWLTSDRVSYRHWLGMMAWCSLPTLLSAVATVVNLLGSNVSLMPAQAANPLAFANLLGMESTGASGADQYLANLDPLSVWSLLLLVLCYRQFSGKGIFLSAAVALAPTLLFVGLALAS